MTYNPLWVLQGNVSANKTERGSRNVYNNTAGTISKGTPVRINAAGNLSSIDPSNEAHIDGFIGIAYDDIPPYSNGEVVFFGTIPNITTTATFGDSVYLSKVGTLTTTKPSIGVAGFLAGDWVIKIGVIAKNPDNPTQKDLVVNIQFLGQL